MLKLGVATLVLGLLPGLALAYCDEMRRKPDGSLCPATSIYDHDFGLCVEKPTG